MCNCSFCFFLSQVGLRQMDMNLLCQLWSLNESISEFRRQVSTTFYVILLCRHFQLHFLYDTLRHSLVLTSVKECYKLSSKICLHK